MPPPLHKEIVGLDAVRACTHVNRAGLAAGGARVWLQYSAMAGLKLARRLVIRSGVRGEAAAGKGLLLVDDLLGLEGQHALGNVQRHLGAHHWGHLHAIWQCTAAPHE